MTLCSVVEHFQDMQYLIIVSKKYLKYRRDS